MFGGLIIVILRFLLCGCTENITETSQIISAHVTSNDEALNLKAALIAFASKNGFNKDIYCTTTTFPGYPVIVFGVIYEIPHARGYTAIGLSYATDVKKQDGCFRVNVVLANSNQSEIKPFINQIARLMRKQLPANTLLYQGTYCGKLPDIAISNHTYLTTS